MFRPPLQFEFKPFEPENFGFAFGNPGFNGQLSQAQIDDIFKTAFSFGSRSPEEIEAMSHVLFPEGTFGTQDGFCYGMGRAALLRYSSEAFVQNRFPAFWTTLVNSLQTIGPSFIGNLNGSGFLLDPYYPYSL